MALTKCKRMGATQKVVITVSQETGISQLDAIEFIDRRAVSQRSLLSHAVLSFGCAWADVFSRRASGLGWCRTELPAIPAASETSWTIAVFDISGKMSFVVTLAKHIPIFDSHSCTQTETSDVIKAKNLKAKGKPVVGY